MIRTKPTTDNYRKGWDLIWGAASVRKELATSEAVPLPTIRVQIMRYAWCASCDEPCPLPCAVCPFSK